MTVRNPKFMAKYWQENVLPHHLKIAHNPKEIILKGQFQDISWLSGQSD